MDKELEALQFIVNEALFSEFTKETNIMVREYNDIVRQSLLKAQKQENVLNILKEKGVDIAVIMATKNVEEYNYFIQYCNSNLNEIEYNLIKEWVDNGRFKVE